MLSEYTKGLPDNVFRGCVFLPRKPRIHYTGAIYHVIIRGNNKKNIFLDTEDYRKFLLICKDYLVPNSLYILAYALLPNHAHLAVEVTDIPLGKFMKMVLQKYTQYFNKKYNTVGHLFQGRYKALIVNRDSYFQQLICYININPKKAGLEKNTGDYPWSGHHELIQNRQFILSFHRLYSYFGDNITTARESYFKLFGQSQDFEPTENNYNKIGTENKESKSAKNRNAIVSPYISLETLLAAAGNAFNIAPSLISNGSKNRQAAAARKVVVFIARHYLNVAGNELAAFLNVSPEYISRVYQDVLINRSSDISEIIDRVLDMVSNDQLVQT